MQQFSMTFAQPFVPRQVVFGRFPGTMVWMQLICLMVLPIAHAQPPEAAPALSAEAMSGQKLAFDRSKGNCLACHTIRGGEVPSNVGPVLDDMKARFPERSELVAIIDNEAARNPRTLMPPFGLNRILTPSEIGLIVDFLYTL
jgi:sulfur-oxidizing protein SoxX